MKHSFLVIFLFNCLLAVNAQVVVTEVGKLPVSVSNNAVCEGFISNSPYLFSFGGIDSTKKRSGIHLKSYRYNITSGKCDRIPDLPDTMGKIAAGASRIGDIIYIAGGYHVLADRSERSSNKMHRYDVENDQYLSDATNIPTATDDHVQAVWRNKLIYLITGWNDVSNIALVQIYDPATNSWSQGTPVPNSDDFKSFGASGSIIGDTLYYFGGASSASGFRIQKTLRKGVINPNKPTEIIWTISTPNSDIKGYRMAATTVNNSFHWLGGSLKTYNYNGIAYNGSGGVEPSHRDLSIPGDFAKWTEDFVTELPMDLRGIGNVNDTLKYIAGGMIDGQTVTNKVYRLTWPNTALPEQNASHRMLKTYPNPIHDKLVLDYQTEAGFDWSVYNPQGQLIRKGHSTTGHLEIATSLWKPGMYFLNVEGGSYSVNQKLVKR